MLKKLKPFCFRNSSIHPNLNKYSICLTCSFLKDCTSGNWDDIEYDSIMAIKTIGDVIKTLNTLATTLESHNPTIGTRLEYESINNMRAKAEGIREVIKVLRKLER